MQVVRELEFAHGTWFLVFLYFVEQVQYEPTAPPIDEKVLQAFPFPPRGSAPSQECSVQ